MLTLVCVSIINAKTVDISDFGAIPEDNKDDSAALQTAFKAIESTGGTIEITGGGKYLIEQPVRFIPTALNVNLILKFDGGTHFEVQLGNPYESAFEAGNLNSFVIENGIFIGRNGTQTNAGWVITQNFVQQSRIVNSQFFNLSLTGGVINTARTNALIESSQFDGNTAPNIILVETYRGLTIRNSQFLDYALFRGVYLSKTPSGVGAWIRAENMLPLNAVGGRRIAIEDCQFDEGATTSISIKNADFVSIKGTTVNMNGSITAIGFLFDNIKSGQVEQSSLGYTNLMSPGIKAVNKSSIEVNGLSLGQGVEHAEVDRTSKIEVKNSSIKIRKTD